MQEKGELWLVEQRAAQSLVVAGVRRVKMSWVLFLIPHTMTANKMKLERPYGDEKGETKTKY